MYAGYAEHLARAFVRRRLTRAGEDAGVYHGAALEGLMDAVREYHPAEGSLTAFARAGSGGRWPPNTPASTRRPGLATSPRARVDLSGFAARLGDRTDRTRRRAATQAKAAIALAVADPDSGLSDAERRLLMAFLDGGAANLTAAAEQAGMHVSRASQLMPRIARRLLRAVPAWRRIWPTRGSSGPGGSGPGSRPGPSPRTPWESSTRDLGPLGSRDASGADHRRPSPSASHPPARACPTERTSSRGATRHDDGLAAAARRAELAAPIEPVR